MPLERAQASGAINQELLIKSNLALTFYWEITKAVKVLICHTKKRVLAEMPVYLSWEGLALPVDDNAAGSCQRFRSPVRATLNTAILEEKNFKWKKIDAGSLKCHDFQTTFILLLDASQANNWLYNLYSL